MNLFSNVRKAAQKRAAYKRTVIEIQSMPKDVAIDLGIFREDAHLIANNAVYS
ncbi:MAG: hypothetical protein ABJP33_01185 [Pseudoruegeria sp.]